MKMKKRSTFGCFTRAGLAAVCLGLMVVVCAAPLRADVDSTVLKAEADRVAVVARASAATVAVFASNGQGGGSGVLISADGYTLSNFHVTREAGDAMKCGLDDGKLYDAVIVGIDPTGDVALLKLLGRDDFPFAEMADSDKVKTGDWCFAIGNPFLLATDFHPTVSYGVISGTHRYQYPAGTLLEYTDCLQADAAINPGNSGGPLFDAQGRLIGINGRGSFEKRGRVNVGVGYAISINQIKNFLGHLKSGRLVDHATLGARLASDEQRRVVVDDILDESDAHRRGLRYGDEIINFAGRPITSVNNFKNVLGIYPKGWRLPLSYRRKGETTNTNVRLAGVHREAELTQMALGQPKAMPERKKPGQKERPKDAPPREPEKKPLELVPQPAAKPMPEIVKQHFVARPGYINYYFNQLNQDRVWKNFVARGDYAALTGDWQLKGSLASGEEFQIKLDNSRVSIELPGGQLTAPMDEDLSDSLLPPGSGGLLMALAQWRRLLVQTPTKFGQVVYVGTAPVLSRDGLHDLLSATQGGVETRFYFDPADGQLASAELYPDENVDPCELYFSEYREVGGHMLPHRIEVRFGDAAYATLLVKDYTFAQVQEK